MRIIRLSRNFGQHAAITAGLSRSRGRWTVVMDCDLEEPPEEIPRLYAKAQEGYEIVRAARLGRRHTGFRRAAGRVYRYLFLETSRTTEYGTLSILSRKVVDAFLSLSERDREYQLMLDWLGFTQATVPFEHGERGEGAQRLRPAPPGEGGLRRHVLPHHGAPAPDRADGVRYRGGRWRPGRVRGLRPTHRGLAAGYTSVVVLLLVLSGFIIISLGVVGLYVGRIFDQVKGRPLFVVEEDRAERATRSRSRRSGAERVDLELEQGPRRRGDATGGTGSAGA